MSCLTHSPINLEIPASLKPKNSVFYFESENFIKSQKKSNKFLKADKLKQKVKQSNTKKTMPLVLFVNLLMKDGKKTQALRILSMTLSLFKTRIFKIKLEKHLDFLKQSRTFYGYFLKSSEIPLDNSTRKFISNYSIKQRNFYYVFSTSVNLKKNISPGLSPSNIIFPWLLKHRKVFPFLFDSFFLENFFYAEKTFFCGKFINLKQYNSIEKKLGKLNLDNEKKENRKSLKLPCFKLFNFKSFLNLKRQTVNLEQKASKKDERQGNFKKCMWYKTLAKRASWENLTTPQKNTFFYCLYKAISNVKPPLECRTKRIGGSNKQIPSQVSEHRQWGIALRWIIEYAQNEFSKKKNKTLGQKDFYRVNSKLILENSENTPAFHEKSKLPRGLSNLGLSMQSKTFKTTIASKPEGVFNSALNAPIKEKQFISSLLQKKPKGGSLKEHCPKTKFLYFCFFLAESLENAYYKRGPAMQKRNLWVETALANRAFLRYRWW